VAIGAEASGGGYLIAWKIVGSEQYAVWNADSHGNYVSNAVLPTSGTSAAMELIETSFHQDLNGDGVIGIHGTTIEAIGATSLTQVGNYYYLDLTASSTGHEVTYNGSPNYASGAAGTWVAIGAEASGGGYLIAWKIVGSEQYAVWNADSHGNYVSNAVMPTSGTSAAMELIETSFHQDLNGDGVIGLNNPSAMAAAGSFQFAAVNAATPTVVDRSHVDAVQPAVTLAASTPRAVPDHSTDLSSVLLADLHAHGFLIQ
jgi:20S proteasome alpha/beta subunit